MTSTKTFIGRLKKLAKKAEAKQARNQRFSCFWGFFVNFNFEQYHETSFKLRKTCYTRLYEIQKVPKKIASKI